MEVVSSLIRLRRQASVLDEVAKQLHKQPHVIMFRKAVKGS